MMTLLVHGKTGPHNVFEKLVKAIQFRAQILKVLAVVRFGQNAGFAFVAALDGVLEISGGVKRGFRGIVAVMIAS